MASADKVLLVGDLITLTTAPGTFLSGDVNGRSVYWSVSPPKLKTPAQFENSLWRICEKLSYSDAELMKSMIGRGRSNSSSDLEKKLIVDQAEKEAERNEDDLKKSRGSTLLYGQIIQLQHVASGLFLAAKSSVAKMDKNCLALYLEKGASSCYFRVSPRYKVRTEGGQILMADEILLCSISSPGFYVHDTPLEGPPLAKGGYLSWEANLSRELTESGVKVELYSRNLDEDEFLRTDSAVSFWMSDNEAFVEAKCDSSIFNHEGGAESSEESEVRFLLTLEHGNDDDAEATARQIFSVDFVERPKKYVPREDVLLILTHTLENGQKLYLHGDSDKDRDESIPDVTMVDSAADTHSTKGQIGLSSVLRNYDALMLFKVQDKFAGLIKFIDSVGPILENHAAFIEREGGSAGVLSSVRGRVDLDIESAVLQQLVEKSIAIELEDELVGDEVFELKAPAFSVFQTCARQQGILEKLIAILAAPSRRGMIMEFSDKNPKKTADWLDFRFKKIERVHKLAWCALKFLVQDNEDSEAHLVSIKATYRHMTAVARARMLQILNSMALLKEQDPATFFNSSLGALLSAGPANMLGYDPIENELRGLPLEEVTGLNILIAQIQFPVGAAETLTDIINGNPILLGQIVDSARIRTFINLIKEEGPSDQFLDFFSAICTCDGVPVRINQDLVLEELIINQDNFSKVLLKMVVLTDEQLKEASQPVPDSYTLPVPIGNPEDIFASEMSGEKAHKIFITWSADDAWEFGLDSLYYSAERMGIPTYLVGGITYCSLVDFCRPLDPEWLEKTEEAVAGDELALQRLQFHKTLVKFFEAQVELYCELLFGRSYFAIYNLENFLPYSMLLSIIFDTKIPMSFRGRFVKLVNRLWVTRFPHAENCGKQSIPELIWVASELKDIKIDDPTALPHFELSPESSLSQHPSRFYSITSADKFQFLTMFLVRFFGEIDRQEAWNTSENVAIGEVVDLFASLTTMGFFPNFDDVVLVTKSVLPLLDGRRDLMHEDDLKPEEHQYRREKGRRGEGGHVLQFGSLQFNPYPKEDIGEVERYKANDETQPIMDTKRNIIKVLLSISKLRDQFYLAKLLYIFKDYARENAEQSRFRKWNEKSLEKAIVAIVDDATADCNRLNYALLSPVPLAPIIIDLLMYEDEKLFEEGFKQLMRLNEDIESLIFNAREVFLLPKNELPVFKTFESLERQVAELRQLFESAEQWSATRSGTEEEKKVIKENYKSIRMIFRNMEEFMAEEPRSDRQESLYLVDMHRILLMPVHWNLQNSSSSPESLLPEPDSLRAVANRSLEVLITLATDHDDIPKALAKEGSALLKAFTNYPQDTKRVILSLLVAVYRGKKAFLLKTPNAVFHTMGQLMAQTPVQMMLATTSSLCLPWPFIMPQTPVEGLPTMSSQCLQFFKNQLVEVDITDTAHEKLVEEDNIGRNQLLVFRAVQAAVMRESPERYVIDYKSLTTVAQLREYSLLIEVLGLAGRRNSACGGAQMEKLVHWKSCMDCILIVMASQSQQSSADLGLGLKDFRLASLEVREILRLDFLRVHIDLFQWVSLNEKSYDDAVVLSRAVYNLARVVLTFARDAGVEAANLLKQRQRVSSLFAEMAESTSMEVDGLTSTNLRNHNARLGVSSKLSSFSLLGGLGKETSSARVRNLEQLKSDALAVDESISLQSLELQWAKQRLLFSCLGFLSSYVAIEKGQHADVFSDLQECCEELVSAPPLLQPAEHIQRSFKVNQRVAHEGATLANASMRAAWKILENNFSHRFEELSRAHAANHEGDGQVVESFKPGRKKMKEESVSSISTKAEKLENLKKTAAEGGDLTKELRAFVDYVSELDLVKDGLKEEEGGILKALLSAGEHTDPNDFAYVTKRSKAQTSKGGVPEYVEVRTNKVEFRDIVRRFIRHIDQKILMAEEHVVSKDLIDILCRYIEDGEDADSDAESDAFEGVDVEIHTETNRRQLELMECGVMDVVYRMIAASGPDDGGLKDKAMRLGALMLDHSTGECAQRLIEYARTHDADGKFFSNLRDELANAVLWVDETKFNPDQGEEEQDNLSADEAEDQRGIIYVIRFMQFLCEGHNLMAQEVLRDQSQFKRQTYNLVESAVELFQCMASRMDVFRRITLVHVTVLFPLLEFLIEVMQGPCPDNQVLLSKLNVFAPCRVILSVNLLRMKAKDRKTKENILMALKGKTARLLAALLEGRQSNDLAIALASKIEPSVFSNCNDSMIKVLSAMNADSSSSSSSSSSDKESDEDFSVDSANTEAIETAINDLLSVRFVLAKALPEYHPTRAAKNNDLTLAKSNEAYLSSSCLIEVSWNSRVEEVFFRKPTACAFLSEGTKLEFLKECEYSTCDARVGSLLENVEKFIDEMETYHFMAEKVPLFRTFMAQQEAFKYVVFAAGILLNFHIIISMINFEVYLSSTQSDFSSPVKRIKLILSAFCCAGYLLLFLFELVPAVFLRRRSLNRQITERVGSGGRRRDCYSPMVVPIGLQIFFFFGCLIHFYDFYPRHDPNSLFLQYGALEVVIFTPLFLHGLRRVVDVPSPANRISYAFCVIMDIIGEADIYTPAFFFGVTMVGILYHYSFFCLLLLDFVSLSEDAKNTVRSITKPWRALVSLVILFLAALVIFGIFGFAYFSPGNFVSMANGLDVKPYGNTSTVISVPAINCHSLSDCLGLVLSAGIISSGDVTSAMNQIYPTASDVDYPGRFFYDVIFYIAIGGLLFNMLTGIVVDTFGEMRHATEERRKGLETQSFLAGLTEEDLDDTSLVPKDLDDGPHNVWNYVYYILYLRKKDAELHNGLESFVDTLVADRAPAWIPRKSCAALQAKGIVIQENKDNNDLANVLELITDMNKSISSRLSLLEERLGKSKRGGGYK